MIDQQSNGTKSDEQQLVNHTVDKLNLESSPLEELQLARVITRKQQQVAFVNYNSDQDDSDSDEEDGRLINIKEYHDNGQPRYFRTYQNCTDSHGRLYQRMIEEKHFDTDGVCRVDVHFAVGQPYLYRKHFWPNQRLKSESVFWVDDEVSMSCKKWGHWRTYYENGNVMSEMQYRDGVRYGFCKRYADDGAIQWVKDYTKQYLERIEHFNEKKGKVAFTIMDACEILGFASVPASMKEVNSQYRTKCAPVHPDKTPDPDATETFLKISRARDVLKDFFEKREEPTGSS